eukprot:UN11436
MLLRGVPVATRWVAMTTTMSTGNTMHDVGEEPLLPVRASRSRCRRVRPRCRRVCPRCRWVSSRCRRVPLLWRVTSLLWRVTSCCGGYPAGGYPPWPPGWVPMTIIASSHCSRRI